MSIPERVMAAGSWDLQLVEDVFGLPCMIIADPVANTPLIIPKRRG